ncbi:hypothetical protein B0H17DRAFT_942006 [Mycena rosella]|uniref:Uncharacterized protein n=1 Tax=Mycena rosella TaxID=1033263 RepID=A0AAD7D961_MYCRO|nr:hypothetical protein B0H17DRAFT_942006 [Mycena rosella]
MACFQILASNANWTMLALATGGNWKKSPVTMSCEVVSIYSIKPRMVTWMPPKGSSDLRKMQAICASLSNRAASTMETGSEGYFISVGMLGNLGVYLRL